MCPCNVFLCIQHPQNRGGGSLTCSSWGKGNILDPWYSLKYGGGGAWDNLFFKRNTENTSARLNHSFLWTENCEQTLSNES